MSTSFCSDYIFVKVSVLDVDKWTIFRHQQLFGAITVDVVDVENSVDIHTPNF